MSPTLPTEFHRPWHHLCLSPEKNNILVLQTGRPIAVSGDLVKQVAQKQQGLNLLLEGLKTAVTIPELTSCWQYLCFQGRMNGGRTR